MIQTSYETFEFLPKPSKSSFLLKQESSPFKVLLIPAFAGMTKEGRFSKVSLYAFLFSLRETALPEGVPVMGTNDLKF